MPNGGWLSPLYNKYFFSTYGGVDYLVHIYKWYPVSTFTNKNGDKVPTFLPLDFYTFWCLLWQKSDTMRRGGNSFFLKWVPHFFPHIKNRTGKWEIHGGNDSTFHVYCYTKRFPKPLWPFFSLLFGSPSWLSDVTKYLIFRVKKGLCLNMNQKRK